MHCLRPLQDEPDFWGVEGTGAFAANGKALEVVYTFFEMAGQMLSLTYKDQKLTILNITACIDCVDEDTSVWRGQILENPFFVPEHMSSTTLFKIPQRVLEIYCLEVTGEPEDEFKACVEANNLKGLEFTKVWTSEEGILNAKQGSMYTVGRPPVVQPRPGVQ